VRLFARIACSRTPPLTGFGVDGWLILLVEIVSTHPALGEVPDRSPDHNAQKMLFDRCAGCEHKRDFVDVPS
jgi:hypothetical protein